MKRILSLCLVFALCVSMLAGVTVPASAASGGMCGEDLTWTLDDSGTLTISGTGAMADYPSDVYTPWSGDSDSIKTVVIEDGVTSIGKSAFSSCWSLTSVTIGDDVTSIGDYAFYWCDKLTSLTIPGSVLNIGKLAFYSCESLTSVTLPDSVTSIGIEAFAYCDSLTDVHYGGTVAARADISIGEGNTSLIDATWHYVKKGTCGENITWTLDDKGTLTISGTGAMTNYPSSSSAPWYSDAKSIKTVVIEDGVTSIGNWAFYNCWKVTSVTIPNSVLSIGDYAFYWCESLASVTIPNSVLNIGKAAFFGCESLTSVTIPDSVTIIGEAAFYGCESLTSVTIPDSVLNIGYEAFRSCDSLTDVYYGGTEADRGGITIGGSNSPLIDATWHYTKKGTCGVSLTWKLEPNGTLTISGTGEMTNFPSHSSTPWYSDIDSIKTVVIEDGVTSVGDHAFYWCGNVTSVTIGDDVLNIGSGAFYGCDMTSVTIPNRVTSIGEDAFSWCNSLTSVTIPNSVIIIGDSAFFWCRALTSVTIGNSVTNIGYEAFNFCDSLTDVYYVGTEEDRDGISIGGGNARFTDATWHYNYKLPPVITLSTVNGAQIRTSGAQGLRFTSSIDKTSLDFDRVVEYGTVLIPTADITDISELTIDATLNGHTVAKVPAKYIFAEDDETVTFTAVLTNIAEKNYAREYTARAYAIMDDGSIVYADAGASRSIYTVAKLGLENPNESDANKEIFQSIVDIVEE